MGCVSPPEVLTYFLFLPRISNDIWSVSIILSNRPSLRKKSMHSSCRSLSNSMPLPISPTQSTDLSKGISYLGHPLITPFVIKHQRYQRHMIFIGWLICIVALLASSCATKVWHLMITQGFLYGAGTVILYYPVLSIVNEWFVKRRGLAYGLM